MNSNNSTDPSKTDMPRLGSTHRAPTSGREPGIGGTTIDRETFEKVLTEPVEVTKGLRAQFYARFINEAISKEKEVEASSFLVSELSIVQGELETNGITPFNYPRANYRRGLLELATLMIEYEYNPQQDSFFSDDELRTIMNIASLVIDAKKSSPHSLPEGLNRAKIYESGLQCLFSAIKCSKRNKYFGTKKRIPLQYKQPKEQDYPLVLSIGKRVKNYLDSHVNGGAIEEPDQNRHRTPISMHLVDKVLTQLFLNDTVYGALINKIFRMGYGEYIYARIPDADLDEQISNITSDLESETTEQIRFDDEYDEDTGLGYLGDNAEDY